MTVKIQEFKAENTDGFNWIACNMNFVDYNDVWNNKQYGSMAHHT